MLKKCALKNFLGQQLPLVITGSVVRAKAGFWVQNHLSIMFLKDSTFF